MYQCERMHVLHAELGKRTLLLASTMAILPSTQVGADCNIHTHGQIEPCACRQRVQYCVSVLSSLQRLRLDGYAGGLCPVS